MVVLMLIAFTSILIRVQIRLNNLEKEVKRLKGEKE